MLEQVTPAYRYRAKVRRVIDGDTYDLDVDCGFRVWAHVPIRLIGWNCPELRQTLGPDARVAADDLLRRAGQVIVETEKDRQSFARWLGRVYVDGVELGALLEQKGLATRA